MSTNITVDGVLFHDIGRQKAPGAHVECLFLQESSGVVIRNSKFTRCDIMDLYVSPVQGGPTASNVVIENNWFDQPTDGGYYAFNLHPDSGTVPTTSPSASTPSTAPSTSTQASTTTTSSSTPTSAASPPATHPASPTATTSGQTRPVVAPTRSRRRASSVQAHLICISRLAARRWCRQSTHGTGRDLDGDARPTRLPPDAGADQRDPASIIPGKSIGAIRLGETETEVSTFYGSLRRGSTIGGAYTASYHLHRGILSAPSQTAELSASAPRAATTRQAGGSGSGPGSPSQGGCNETAAGRCSERASATPSSTSIRDEEDGERRS